ncbi:MAG: SBBP repeat-containing protein, partial [Bacteroidales bacterium]|nr:SBBP repeat-containing protein [Bacteroidales bacterium]
NYPVSSGAFQPWNRGAYDGFVTKLNPAGDSLIFSTYLGGSSADDVLAIAVDDSGYVYATGPAASSNFPITPGAYQTSHEGGTWAYDVFVTKLNTAGTDLVFSTYLGGNGEEMGLDIAVDDSGYVYVTGFTSSTNFDTTLGAYQTTPGGNWDAFLTKLNPDGTGLVYSTYLGGSGNEWSGIFGNIWDGSFYGTHLAIDSLGYVYVCGTTNSIDFDTTMGAYQTTHQGGWDIFVTKFNTTGSGLVYSTYIGGSNNDLSADIAIDHDGNAYVVGYTTSANYPVTNGAYQMNLQGAHEVFVTKLNSSGTVLLYSTYFGGTNSDNVQGMAIDSNGCVYLAGFTYSTDFDITTGAYQQIHEGGGDDGYLSKLCLYPCSNVVLVSDSGTVHQEVCKNHSMVNILYYIYGSVDVTVGGLPAGVNWVYENDTLMISGIPSNAGIFHYTISIIGCGTDTMGVITVNDLPVVTATATPDTVCEGQLVVLSASGADTYMWDQGLGSGQTHQIFPSVTTTYTVTGSTLHNCTDTTQVKVTVYEKPLGTVFSNAPICSGDSLIINASGGNTYVWAGPNGFSWGDSAVMISSAQVSYSGTYVVTISTHPGCDTVLTINVDIYGKPVVDFEVRDEVCDEGNGKINVRLTSGELPITYHWSNGSHDSLLTNLREGTYVLTVIDGHGCTSVDSVEVKNDSTGCEYFVEMPTGFSPNGDGVNDILLVRGKGVEEIVFEVYNRWGNKVFESHEIDKGWDGTYRNVEQESGIYAYVVNVKFKNGKRFKKTGDVALIR